jgi:hypothetical protein
MDAIALGYVNHGPKSHLRSGGIADRQEVGFGRKLTHVRAVQTAMHEMPARGHADLPLVQKGAPRSQRDRLVEIGVVQHDQSRLASELEMNTLQRRGCGAGDHASGACRTGEGENCNVWIGGHRFPDVRSARQNAEQPLREARFFENAGKDDAARD